MCALLGNLDQVDETTFTFLEASHDGLFGELRELFILHDKVVKVITQVVSARSTAVAVENTKETDLRPFNLQILLALWLKNVENDGHSILVVVANNSLVSISSVRFNYSTLLLRSLGGLMILKK